MTRALLVAFALLAVGCAEPADVLAPSETAPAAALIADVAAAPAPETFEPTAPEPRVLVVAAPVREAAVLAAIDAWNAALGREALVLGAFDTEPSLPGHVYLHQSADLPSGYGGWTTCPDFVAACELKLRSDCVGSPKVIAHELGHVMGGAGHTDVPGSLMYWSMATSGGPVVITAADVDFVLGR